jgi:hypothetical protein
MAYITSEEISEKRKAIKKAFPKWKFSITRRHYSTIVVDILEADIKLTDKPYEGVNHFYIKDHYQGEIKEALQQIADIMIKGEKIVSEDSDYGSIPNFYVDLNIGKWDKPFIYKAI